MVKEGKAVGTVFSYYSKIGVAAIKLSAGLKVGDKIRVKGTSTDFEQEIDSIQMEHEAVEKGKKGESVGIRMKDKVRPNDTIYKL